VRVRLALPPVALAVAGYLLATLAAGTAPAAASPTVVHGVPEASEAVLSLGSAAALGAGSAASDVLADRVEKVGIALGGAVVTVRPAGVATTTTTLVSSSALTWTWKGWVSGASGPETLGSSFGAFRGEPVGLVGVWADRGAETQTRMASVGEYAGFNGEMDVAVGALVKGETWEEAAAGQFVARWTTAVRNLKAMRAGKGTTYIRIAHEMNGDWMVWGVTSKNLQAYKKGYRLYASIVRKEFPQARLTWSPNGGNHTDVSIDDLWPGGDVVDVIGPDIYDFDPDPTTAGSWSKETNKWLTAHSPTGLDAWRQYAAKRGKPIALPEWGLASGDDPGWITKVHDAMARYAAGHGSRQAAGRFVYDCYFNAEQSFKLLNGPNTAAADAYAKLVWGS
jgi:hypothetical protein